MQIPFLGLSITRTKAIVGQLQTVQSHGLWQTILESYGGAWQSNVTVELTNVLTHPTIFSCVTLIASDIAKMRLRLVELDDDGIWNEVQNVAFSPVLRKPNRYQNRIKFVQGWQISRLIYGNTYVLKQRDQRGVVVALYVLDPTRVSTLVAPNGDVYYALKRDDLSHIPEELAAVPASEIIHDVMYPLYHPLVGVGPIHASGLAATLGLKILSNSSNFFANGSQPGGVLTAPGAISDTTAARLKAYWDTNYTGANVGKVAVLGDGLKYEPMAVTAEHAQLTGQWEATSKAVCSAYHVPGYKVGVGEPPSYNNIEALDRQYYAQALQEPIESMELLLDEGLGLGPTAGNRYGAEFDLSDLLRMDTATLVTTLGAGVGAALYSPDEARKMLNLRPVPGGASPYLQQQNYSLAALDRRDSREPAPPSVTPPQLPPAADDVADTTPDNVGDTAKFAVALLTKVARFHHAA